MVRVEIEYQNEQNPFHVQYAVDKYPLYAKKVERVLVENGILVEKNPGPRGDFHCCPGMPSWYYRKHYRNRFRYPRLAAFEITLHDASPRPISIFSKILSKSWPSVGLVRQRVDSILKAIDEGRSFEHLRYSPPKPSEPPPIAKRRPMVWHVESRNTLSSKWQPRLPHPNASTSPRPPQSRPQSAIGTISNVIDGLKQLRDALKLRDFTPEDATFVFQLKFVDLMNAWRYKQHNNAITYSAFEYGLDACGIGWLREELWREARNELDELDLIAFAAKHSGPIKYPPKLPAPAPSKSRPRPHTATGMRSTPSRNGDGGRWQATAAPWSQRPAAEIIDSFPLSSGKLTPPPTVVKKGSVPSSEESAVAGKMQHNSAASSHAQQVKSPEKTVESYKEHAKVPTMAAKIVDSSSDAPKKSPEAAVLLASEEPLKSPLSERQVNFAAVLLQDAPSEAAQSVISMSPPAKQPKEQQLIIETSPSTKEKRSDDSACAVVTQPTAPALLDDRAGDVASTHSTELKQLQLLGRTNESPSMVLRTPFPITSPSSAQAPISSPFPVIGTQRPQSARPRRVNKAKKNSEQRSPSPPAAAWTSGDRFSPLAPLAHHCARGLPDRPASSLAEPALTFRRPGSACPERAPSRTQQLGSLPYPSGAAPKKRSASEAPVMAPLAVPVPSGMREISADSSRCDAGSNYESDFEADDTPMEEVESKRGKWESKKSPIFELEKARDDLAEDKRRLDVYGNDGQSRMLLDYVEETLQESGKTEYLDDDCEEVSGGLSNRDELEALEGVSESLIDCSENESKGQMFNSDESVKSLS